jgi:hemophore-related protein
MSTPVVVARRIAATVLGAGAVLIGGAAPATANPGCTAGDITAVESQVATALTAYFFTHPAANDFFTSVQGLPKAEATSKTKAYLAANPQTQAEINAIRGPVFDLRNRCNIPTNNLIRGVL